MRVQPVPHFPFHFKTNLIATGVLLVLFGWIATPAQAAVTIIDDGDFAPQNWTVTPVGAANLAQITVTQELNGGNPEFFRKTASAAADQYFDFLNLRNGAVYDPSEQGPIASVDWSLDVLSISNSIKGWAGIYEVVVVQDGVIFEGGSAQASEPGWFSWPPQTRIRQDDFNNVSGTGPEHPDFSRNGGPLQFGYIFAASKRGGVSGLDNLVIKLNTSGGATGANLFAEWHDDFLIDCRPIQGGKMKCSISALIVTNDGSARAPKSGRKGAKVAFFLSEDNVLDAGDVPVGTKTIAPLKPGKSKTYTLQFTLPKGVNLEKASGKFLIAVVDSANKIPETDEEDNVAVVEIP